MANPEFDLIIRNGSIVDGTGRSAYRGDVGIRGGQIAEIGVMHRSAVEEIDATDHVVTPGFVDGHTHMDAQVMWDEAGSSSCWHGVTTVVMGNCGFTLAPVEIGRPELVVRNLERAEDIPAEALAAGLAWDWSSFSDYLDVVDRRPKAINYAAYVGHSALRTWAMGERAFEGPATDDDVREMERELRGALRAGAIGLSTSRLDLHQTSDDRPVASRLASWDELCQLAMVVGEVSSGFLEIALESAVRSDDPAEQGEVRDRLQALVLASKVTCTFGIAPTRKDERDWRGMLELIESTVARGGAMFGQSHSRGISSVLSFETSMPFDSLPRWNEVRTLPVEQQRAALLDPAMVDELVEEAATGSYRRAVGAEPRRPVYDQLLVLESPLPPHRSVAEVAAQMGLDPVRAIIALALETNFEQKFLQPLSLRDDDVLLAIMRHPETVMTFSDSGAHVSQIMDSSIHTHFLAYWVRERGEFSLEDAVHEVTEVPARRWNFHDRGTITVGKAADINIFDPDTIAPEMPRVVADLPGGARRLVQGATGMLATIVNGQVTLRSGAPTEARPGRLLRRAPASR